MSGASVARLLDKASPAPIQDAMLGKSGRPTPRWADWFVRAPSTFHAIPSILSVTSLEEQNAAISATDFADTKDLAAGLYLVMYTARITTAAGVSSSLTVTVKWTEGAVVQTQAGAAITGNTTTSRQGGVFLIRSDAGEDVTYETAYASNAAGAMKYSLDISLAWVRPQL